MKEPFGIPKVIKSVKQAGNELLQKVNRFDFKTKKDQILDWMKEHKKAVLVGAAALTTAATAMLGAAINNLENNNEDNKTPVEAEMEVSATENTVEPTEQVNTNTEMTEDEIFNAELQETLNNVLDGEQKVYVSVENATNDTNGLSTTDSQRENSWANSEANAFYGEDNQILTRDEAEAVINNGGEVVARFDNNGTPIGYVTVGQSIDNNSGITK